MESLTGGFFYAFVRCASFISFSPVFSSPAIPSRAKIGLALLLSMYMVSLFPKVSLPTDEWQFLGILMGEMFIGFFMGTLLQFLFKAVEMAGQWISLQMGFGFGGLYDPEFDAQTDAVTMAYHWLVIVVFFSVKGHHQWLQALAKSWEWVPPGSLCHLQTGLGGWLLMSRSLFVVSLQMAAPLLFTLWITSMVLGFLGRMLTQFNVFMVDFPIKISVGLVGLGVTLPFISTVFERALRHCWPAMGQLLHSLRG